MSVSCDRCSFRSKDLEDYRNFHGMVLCIECYDYEHDVVGNEK